MAPKCRKSCRRRRVRRGGSLFGSVGKWVKKANGFLRRTKLISKVGTPMAHMLGPKGKVALGLATKLGYGRRRYGRGISLAGGCLNGKGLRLAGSGLRLAGRGKYSRR